MSPPIHQPIENTCNLPVLKLETKCIYVLAAEKKSSQEKLRQHRINAKNRIIQWVPNKNCE